MKLLKQKTTGEIYVWNAELAKRDDMVEFIKETKVQPQEVVNEEETSVGSTEPEERKQEAQPKSKSPSKGKR